MAYASARTLGNAVDAGAMIENDYLFMRLCVLYL